MSSFLTKYPSESAYQADLSSGLISSGNISFIEDTGKIHYDPDGCEFPINRYKVKYNVSGIINESGSVPIDSNNYQLGDSAIILDNFGNLEISGLGQFIGWTKTLYSNIISNPNIYPDDLVNIGDTIIVNSDINLYPVYTNSDGLYVRTMLDGIYHRYSDIQSSDQFNMDNGDIIVIVKNGEHYGLHTDGTRVNISDGSSYIVAPAPSQWQVSYYQNDADLTYEQSVNRTYLDFYGNLMTANRIGVFMAPMNNDQTTGWYTPTNAYDNYYYNFTDTTTKYLLDCITNFYDKIENDKLIGEEWHVPSYSEFNLIYANDDTIKSQLKDIFVNHMNGGVNYYGNGNIAWMINSVNNSGTGSRKIRRYSWNQGTYVSYGSDSPSYPIMNSQDDMPMIVMICKIYKSSKFNVGISTPSLSTARAFLLNGNTSSPTYSTISKGESYVIPSVDISASPFYAVIRPPLSADSGLYYPDTSQNNPVEIVGTIKFIGFIDSNKFKFGSNTSVIYTTQTAYDTMKPYIYKSGDIISGINRGIILISVFMIDTLIE